ncbi:redoxin domain-containing protein, partial [Bifidobacterium longum]
MTATVHDSAQAPVYARLQEGSDAPDFTLPAIVPGTAENGLINLSDVLEDGRRVVLYFYPAAMTPGCTTEACDFRDNLARLESQIVAVLGV